jgi:hypothetical protein
MGEKSNGKPSLATMSYDALAATLQERAKAMMAARNVNSAVVFGTLARRFTDAARELSTYSINEAAIAQMITENPDEAQNWAKEKLDSLATEAQK